MKKFLLTLIVIFYYGTFSKDVLASCDFQTGNFIDELSLPNSIKRIDINLNKPRNYYKNAFKIISNPNIFIKKRKKIFTNAFKIVITIFQNIFQ